MLISKGALGTVSGGWSVGGPLCRLLNHCAQGLRTRVACRVVGRWGVAEWAVFLLWQAWAGDGCLYPVCRTARTRGLLQAASHADHLSAHCGSGVRTRGIVQKGRADAECALGRARRPVAVVFAVVDSGHGRCRDFAPGATASYRLDADDSRLGTHASLCGRHNNARLAVDGGRDTRSWRVRGSRVRGTVGVARNTRTYRVAQVARDEEVLVFGRVRGAGWGARGGDGDRGNGRDK